LVAIDGTSNNNNKQQVMLNMCSFDVTNNVPINLTSCWTKNRNKEIQEFIVELKNNPDKYKNVIFVCDRFYHSYELFDYLVSNNYKFIIRIKVSGNLSIN
jgi:hypothetical protein